MLEPGHSLCGGGRAATVEAISLREEGAQCRLDPPREGAIGSASACSRSPRSPNHNGQIRVVYFDGTNTRTAYSSKGVVDGAWHHLVVWFDRDTGITISVDGVTKLTTLAIGPDVSNTGELQIGKAPNNPYYKGDIDEVALYAGLLPADRIQAHAAAAA